MRSGFEFFFLPREAAGVNAGRAADSAFNEFADKPHPPTPPATRERARGRGKGDRKNLTFTKLKRPLG